METVICDYLIIGAGAAGCVVANRLTNYNQLKIICIEAGGNDHNPFIKMPAGFSKTVYNPHLNWPYFTTPSKVSFSLRTSSRRFRLIVHELCIISASFSPVKTKPAPPMSAAN